MSDDRPQRTTYEQNSPYVTSDANQQQRLTAGLGVVEGFEITAPASEGGLTAEIDAGVAWMGETVGVSSATVSFESDDSDPRKIVIYVDGAGDIEVAQGDPAPPKPAGKSGRLTYQPVAPPLDGVEAVVLWEGYIPPGATAASDDMFDDRRDESRISVDTVEAAKASVEEPPEAETDVARKQETDALDAAKADTPHDLAGDDHSADTLANLNTKVSDATLDDSGDAREPEAHSGTHENGGTDEMSVADLSGVLADPQKSQTQDSGTNVVASSILNFGTALDVTDDGGVARIDNAEPGENVPDWVEDPNSPFTEASSENIVCSLADSYERVEISVRCAPTGNASNIEARLNAVSTSDYEQIRFDGSEETGQDSFGTIASVVDGDVANFDMRSGESLNGIGLHSFAATANNNRFQTGTIDGERGPISNIEFISSPATDVEWTVEVFGRTL